LLRRGRALRHLSRLGRISFCLPLQRVGASQTVPQSRCSGFSRDVDLALLIGTIRNESSEQNEKGNDVTHNAYRRTEVLCCFDRQ
jgi:hypothetical protein